MLFFAARKGPLEIETLIEIYRYRSLVGGLKLLWVVCEAEGYELGFDIETGTITCSKAFVEG